MSDRTLVHVPARTLPVKTFAGVMWRPPITTRSCRTCPLLSVCHWHESQGHFAGCETPLTLEVKT